MRLSLKDKAGSILSIFDLLAMPAFIIDDARLIISVNNSALDMFLYKKEDLTGADIMNLLSANSSGKSDNFY